MKLGFLYKFNFVLNKDETAGKLRKFKPPGEQDCISKMKMSACSMDDKIFLEKLEALIIKLKSKPDCEEEIKRINKELIVQ